MIAEQAELRLRTRRESHGVENDVRELEQLLRGRSGLTAAEIETLRPAWREPDHRYVRKLASLSPAIVSAPGVAGYHLASEIALTRLRRMAEQRAAQIRAEGRELVRLRRLIALRVAADILIQPSIQPPNQP